MLAQTATDDDALERIHPADVSGLDGVRAQVHIVDGEECLGSLERSPT